MRRLIPHQALLLRVGHVCCFALIGIVPLLAQNPFQITDLKVVDGYVEISWNGDADFYEIQRSTTLTSDGWTPITYTNDNSILIQQELGLGSYFIRVLKSAPRETFAIPDERRLEILDEISTQIDSLSDQEHIDSTTLTAFLGQFTELDDIDVHSDGTVYARFMDNRLYAIIDNRPPALPDAFDESGNADFLSAEENPVRQALIAGQANRVGGRVARSTNGTPGGLPVSKNAVLFQAEGTGIDSPMLDSLVPAFEERGFAVKHGDATLFNFMNMEALGNDIGVFYVDSHGGSLEAIVKFEDPTTGLLVTRKFPLFLLMTSTEVTAENERLYKPLLEEGLLMTAALGPQTVKGIKRNHTLKNPTAPPLTKWPHYYGVTATFVKRYWRFGKNSFVYLDCCYSQHDDAEPFRRACFRAGAATYAGWTESVHDAWPFNKVTRPLFDTLLGGSQIYRVNPPQRPFELSKVLNYLEQKNFLTDATPGFPGAKFVCSPGLSSNGGFRMLFPSIERMDVAETTGEIIMSGSFDANVPAVVRVDASEGATTIDAKMVRGSLLTFELPGDESPSVGDITVTQNDLSSNQVPLTEWRVKATMVKHFAPFIAQPSATSLLDLHFRADAHPWRNLPFSTPKFRGAAASIATDSMGRVVEASGQFDRTDGRSNVRWSLDQPVDVPFAGLRGTFSISADGTASIYGALLAGRVMTVTETVDGVPTVYLTEPGQGAKPGGTSTTLDLSSYTINAATDVAAGDSGQFSFESAASIHPPTGDFAR